MQYIYGNEIAVFDRRPFYCAIPKPRAESMRFGRARCHVEFSPQLGVVGLWFGFPYQMMSRLGRRTAGVGTGNCKKFWSW